MDQGKEFEINQDNFKQAEKHIAVRKGTKFLNDFQTIAKFLNNASLWKEYDLVVIDECSTVSYRYEKTVKYSKYKNISDSVVPFL